MSNLWYELTDEDDMEIPWDEHNPYLDDDESEIKLNKWEEEWEDDDDDDWDELDDFEII
jgi:hypothetical protein